MYNLNVWVISYYVRAIVYVPLRMIDMSLIYVIWLRRSTMFRYVYFSVPLLGTTICQTSGGNCYFTTGNSAELFVLYRICGFDCVYQPSIDADQNQEIRAVQYVFVSTVNRKYSLLGYFAYNLYVSTCIFNEVKTLLLKLLY